MGAAGVSVAVSRRVAVGERGATIADGLRAGAGVRIGETGVKGKGRAVVPDGVGSGGASIAVPAGREEVGVAATVLDSADGPGASVPPRVAEAVG